MGGGVLGGKAGQKIMTRHPLGCVVGVRDHLQPRGDGKATTQGPVIHT